MGAHAFISRTAPHVDIGLHAAHTNWPLPGSPLSSWANDPKGKSINFPTNTRLREEKEERVTNRRRNKEKRKREKSKIEEEMRKEGKRKVQNRKN